MKILPMLALPYDPESFKHFVGSVYIQPKLDGHRAIWDGKNLYSRQLKTIVSVPGIIEELNTHFKGFPLDGELFFKSKKGAFKKTTSICRRTVNIEDNDSVIYYVYDHPIDKAGFSERLSIIKSKFSQIDSLKRIKILETKKLHLDKTADMDILNPYKSTYEGTMIRFPNGLYDFGGRSSDLIKVKEFKDAEGTITGIEELTKKAKVMVPEGTPGSKRYADGTYYKDGVKTPTGTLGSFVVQTADGKTFNVGSGFTKKQRAEFYHHKYIGRVITYKYQELSEDGIPRFPVFLRFREDI